MRDLPRAPARARMTATLNAAGGIDALVARIAVPSTNHEFRDRLFDNTPADVAQRAAAGKADAAAVEGAANIYAIPHVAIDSALAGETPVVLAVAGADTPWPHTDLLFNLADDLPSQPEDFRMLIEIVGQDDAEKHAARQRWATYRQRGYELKAFDAERRVAL